MPRYAAFPLPILGVDPLPHLCGSTLQTEDSTIQFENGSSTTMDSEDSDLEDLDCEDLEFDDSFYDPDRCDYHNRDSDPDNESISIDSGESCISMNTDDSFAEDAVDCTDNTNEEYASVHDMSPKWELGLPEIVMISFKSYTEPEWDEDHISWSFSMAFLVNCVPVATNLKWYVQAIHLLYTTGDTFYINGYMNW